MSEPSQMAVLSMMRLPEDVARFLRAIEHPVWIEKIVTVVSEQPYLLSTRPAWNLREQGMKIGYVTDYIREAILERVLHLPASSCTFARASNRLKRTHCKHRYFQIR